MFVKKIKDNLHIKAIKDKIPPQYLGGLPTLEFVGNRQVIIEGSKGILKYSDDTIRINTGQMIITFYGKDLNVRCISPDCTKVDGFIYNLEFSF